MKSLALITVIFFSVLSTAQVKELTAGDSMLNVSGTDDKGVTTSLSYFKVKYILLNFTATQCGPCWNVYDQLVAIQEKYDDKLVVVSFHIDEDIDLWRSIAKKKKINFSCRSIWYCDNKKEITATYGVKGYPYFVLINHHGIIEKMWFGNKERKLFALLKRKLE